jgi:formyl-CoA transferase
MPGPLPLDGITVVSLEQAVAAPFATRQLADLGARVIKIERPGGGDFARHYDRTVWGQSSYFVWLNRSKESVVLDLKAPSGLAALRALVAKADVVLQNLAPGALGRLGLSPDQMRAEHPGLVVCSISGYGPDGPWSDRKAYDLIVQCETGLPTLTGTPDVIARAGISVADIAAGMYAFSGTLAALLRRARTGEGAHVDISLFEAIAEWVSQPAYYANYSGAAPLRVGAEHATIAPYGCHRTADGRTLVLAVQSQAEWVRFAGEFLGDPALVADERFATNSDRVAHRDDLNALVSARCAELTLERLEAALDVAGIAHGRLNDMHQFWGHEQLAARDRWRQVATPEGAIRAMLPPIELAGAEARMDGVPGYGEHTDSVLRELGLSG